MNTGHTELPNTYHQGYCYLDVLTGLFWVDINDTSGSEKRIALNAHSANQSVNAVLPTIDTTTGLHNVEPIYSTYVRSIGPGTTNGTIIANRYGGDKDTITVPGLKNLAFSNTATASYTPTGRINYTSLTITPSTTSASLKTEDGILPTLSTSVSNEVLTFNWAQGAMPTFTQKDDLWQGVTTSKINGLEFIGDSATITSYPETGGGENPDGDSVYF